MAFRPFFGLSEENFKLVGETSIFFLERFFIVKAQNDIEINIFLKLNKWKTSVHFLDFLVDRFAI